MENNLKTSIVTLFFCFSSSNTKRNDIFYLNHHISSSSNPMPVFLYFCMACSSLRECYRYFFNPVPDLPTGKMLIILLIRKNKL